MLLINEMDPSTNSGRLAKWFETRVARNGANFLEPRELEELVASHGFKVVEERKGRHDYFVLAQNQKASDESSGWIDYDAPAQSNSIPPRE